MGKGGKKNIQVLKSVWKENGNLAKVKKGKIATPKPNYHGSMVRKKEKKINCV